ncbi:ABC transporter A family member 7 [Bienertia sinuspersici]
MNNFNVSVWYNATYKNDTGFSSTALLRVPRSVNLVSNAYLQSLLGPGTRMFLDFVKEMPKPATRLSFNIAALLSGQFFTYVILLLFPVVLTTLVYEKQQRLRIMMKMHGLGDGPYWTISYAYFLAISIIYMIVFVLFGSFIGLKFFTTNDYSIQFVFYFIYINLQISMAFLVAPIFANILTARAVGYLLVFSTGLLGGFLFEFFIEDTSFPRVWIIVMELYPGFSLYRGLYEFREYSFLGDFMGTHGMQWEDLGDSRNGMKEVLIIMFVEWLVVLPIAFYVDQAVSSGSGMKRSPLFFLRSLLRKSSSVARTHSLEKQGSKVSVEMEKADVVQERERVEHLLTEPSSSISIICDNLRKIYPGRDGNPSKLAVKGLSLAVPRGECFGMLGPNGAGKTSFISMMIGLIEPSSGAAYVEGSDICSQMHEIYTSMGVCPQHEYVSALIQVKCVHELQMHMDLSFLLFFFFSLKFSLLWETLTGREHLIFYGRLKNLKGSALMQAVEESLRSVNLYHGGVADKLAGKYSGGMKRRLSVAISLIGDPKVVYMDEPSTGLDPASRNNLWNVVTQAKQGRAIILTTHSMEEAEVLCDRIGIFVDGNMQCIGGPKQLKGRYGGSFVLTMTTSAEHELEVETMVRSLSQNAQKIYHISGTQKFEIPKQEIRISDVFKAIEKLKKRFTVQAWGLADTTLEDVFIKVAREAQSSDVLS